MSRPMRSSEIAAFEAMHGYKPTALRVAIDAVGIFVHRDNPIKGLNFQQLDAIFSATLRCGATQPIVTWSQLGLPYDWAKRNIQLFGRNSVSGTYGYFKQNALCQGDFQNRVNEQPGSASVVQSVASSINTLGYSGVGYRVSGVKLLPIAREGNDYVEPTQANILSGAYPLSRYLYVYVNKILTEICRRLSANLFALCFTAGTGLGCERWLFADYGAGGRARVSQSWH